MGELVDRAGHAAFKRFGFSQSAIVSRWHEIVGPVIARHSRPEALRLPPGGREGGVLELRVSGAFAPRLQMAERDIITQVNRFFGRAAVARLRLLHGLVPAEAECPAPAPAVPSALEPSLKAISDPGLRAALEGLARQLGATEGAPVFDADSGEAVMRPDDRADAHATEAADR